MRRVLIVLLLGLLALAGFYVAGPGTVRPRSAQAQANPPAPAEPQAAPESPTDGEGLPTPRFVSLGSGEVNVRVGPGGQYPVSFTFIKEDLPVEVIADFELWRKIRDFDGSEGWVHMKLLKGRRTALVTGERRTLRAKPDENAAPVARADPGVIGRLRKCEGAWCEMEAKGYRGWIKRDEIWGVYPGENFD